jgi:alpha-amylase
MKECMIEYFEWYVRNDGWHWNRLKKDALHLKKLGYTMVWMPPAYKGSKGSKDVGYGVYDLYDLGEFKQKGSVRTKYGTKEQYEQAVAALQKRGIKVLADIVLNHRMGADQMEEIRAKTMDWNDRNRVLEPAHPVKVWTKYNFRGRKGKYSPFLWNASCFVGTDYDVKKKKHELLLFEGKKWDPYVSLENGNFDYIMGNDVDFCCPWVVKELYDWGKWYMHAIHPNGFRLDAIKNIDARFFPGWLQEMERFGQTSLFAVGEYWSWSLAELENYLHQCHFCMCLFDVPLHFHLEQASKSNGQYDIRRIFDDTLSQKYPDYAVAFVDNHDTQPNQALYSWVEDWFKTSAYALILLYRCKYPCVFYGDYKGIPHDKKDKVVVLDEMVWIRSHLLSDQIVDCFDEDSQKACWIALGMHPVAVLFTIGDYKEKYLCFQELSCKTLVDITQPANRVTIQADGSFKLICRPGQCSVYISAEDYEQMKKELRIK